MRIFFIPLMIVSIAAPAMAGVRAEIVNFDCDNEKAIIPGDKVSCELTVQNGGRDDLKGWITATASFPDFKRSGKLSLKASDGGGMSGCSSYTPRDKIWDINQNKISASYYMAECYDGPVVDGTDFFASKNHTMNFSFTPSELPDKDFIKLYIRATLADIDWKFIDASPGTATDQQKHVVEVSKIVTLNKAPVVALLSPAAGTATLYKGIAQDFSATITDSNGNLESYKILVDGVQVKSGSARGGEKHVDYATAFNSLGLHKVAVLAKDKRGYEGIAIWQFNVVEPAGDLAVSVAEAGNAGNMNGITVELSGTKLPAKVTPNAAWIGLPLGDYYLTTVDTNKENHYKEPLWWNYKEKKNVILGQNQAVLKRNLPRVGTIGGVTDRVAAGTPYVTRVDVSNKTSTTKSARVTLRLFADGVQVSELVQKADIAGNTEKTLEFPVTLPAGPVFWNEPKIQSAVKVETYLDGAWRVTDATSLWPVGPTVYIEKPVGSITPLPEKFSLDAGEENEVSFKLRNIGGPASHSRVYISVSSGLVLSGRRWSSVYLHGDALPAEAAAALGAAVAPSAVFVADGDPLVAGESFSVNFKVSLSSEAIGPQKLQAIGTFLAKGIPFSAVPDTLIRLPVASVPVENRQILAKIADGPDAPALVSFPQEMIENAAVWVFGPADMQAPEVKLNDSELSCSISTNGAYACPLTLEAAAVGANEAIVLAGGRRIIKAFDTVAAPLGVAGGMLGLWAYSLERVPAELEKVIGAIKSLPKIIEGESQLLTTEQYNYKIYTRVNSMKSEVLPGRFSGAIILEDLTQEGYRYKFLVGNAQKSKDLQRPIKSIMKLIVEIPELSEEAKHVFEAKGYNLAGKKDQHFKLTFAVNDIFNSDQAVIKGKNVFLKIIPQGKIGSATMEVAANYRAGHLVRLPFDVVAIKRLAQAPAEGFATKEEAIDFLVKALSEISENSSKVKINPNSLVGRTIDAAYNTLAKVRLVAAEAAVRIDKYGKVVQKLYVYYEAGRAGWEFSQGNWRGGVTHTARGAVIVSGSWVVGAVVIAGMVSDVADFDQKSRTWLDNYYYKVLLGRIPEHLKPATLLLLSAIPRVHPLFFSIVTPLAIQGLTATPERLFVVLFSEDEDIIGLSAEKWIGFNARMAAAIKEESSPNVVNNDPSIAGFIGVVREHASDVVSELRSGLGKISAPLVYDEYKYADASVISAIREEGKTELFAGLRGLNDLILYGSPFASVSAVSTELAIKEQGAGRYLLGYHGAVYEISYSSESIAWQKAESQVVDPAFKKYKVGLDLPLGGIIKNLSTAYTPSGLIMEANLRETAHTASSYAGVKTGFQSVQVNYLTGEQVKTVTLAKDESGGYTGLVGGLPFEGVLTAAVRVKSGPALYDVIVSSIDLRRLAEVSAMAQTATVVKSTSSSSLVFPVSLSRVSTRPYQAELVYSARNPAAGDDGSAVEMSLSSGVFSAVISSRPAGSQISYHFVIRDGDSTFRIPAENFEFYVDTAAPRLTKLSAEAQASGSAILSLAVADDLSGVDPEIFGLTVNGSHVAVSSGILVSFLAGEAGVSLPGVGPGIHSIEIKAADLAGNTLTASTKVHVRPAGGAGLGSAFAYPNPVKVNDTKSTHFSKVMTFSAPPFSVIEIFTVHGEKLGEVRVSAGGSGTWDVRSVPSGVYIGRIKSSAGSRSIKLGVQK